MFIIDFDDTLFDTHAFKQARLDAVLPLGISEDVYWHTYAQTRAGTQQEKLYTYSNERHAEMLAQKGFDKEAVYSVLAATMRAEVLSQFLFKDAHTVLKYIKNTSEKMILLSLGDTEFQKQKIHGSGIAEYFDEIHIVEKDKKTCVVDVIQKNMAERAWFINDKPVETMDVYAACPQTIPILKISKQYELREYEQTNIPAFHTLTHIQTYVHTSTRS